MITRSILDPEPHQDLDQLALQFALELVRCRALTDYQRLAKEAYDLAQGLLDEGERRRNGETGTKEEKQ